MENKPDGNRPPKKRKTNQETSLKLAGKVINLSGFLNAPIKDDIKIPIQPNQEATKASIPPIQDKPHQDAVGVPENPAKSKAGTTEDQTLLQVRMKLPIWPERTRIKTALRRKDILLVVGETGSGKSTQVPQFLHEEPWCISKKIKVKGQDGECEVTVGGMIAVTQPRRVAATTLARRVAQEIGTPLGKSNDGLVGYSVRFDHHVPKGTRIKFLTEGMLLQEILRDRCLRQYSAVIVDEIHERSVDVDLISGFLKQVLLGDRAGRGGVPLKVVIMSATANIESLQRFFATDMMPDCWGGGAETSLAEVLLIPGRQYPVTTSYINRPLSDLQDGLVKAIYELHVQEPLPGDILVFLDGQSEIESLQKVVEEYATTLDASLPKVQVVPLFGQLSIEAQQEAFQPTKSPLTRKVILATNIAETSVTVPGVRYVVDSGKAKVKQFRSKLGLESLLSQKISKSSAIQRAGRAGREGPGKCKRLYTEDTFNTLEVVHQPEILRADVLSAVLTMKARGVDDILTFPLMDTPSRESLRNALLQLFMMKALDATGGITEAGLHMAKLPIPVPYARVLLSAAEPKFDCLLEVIDIIAMTTAGEYVFHRIEENEEDAEELRNELYRREGDLLTYLTTMQRYTAEEGSKFEWCKQRKIDFRTMKQAVNIRRQLRELCHKDRLLANAPPRDPQPAEPMQPDRAEDLLKCFLLGFATRTAILAPDGGYHTILTRQSVAIHPSSVLHGQKKEAIMFLQHVYTTRSYGRVVSVVQSQWIEEAMAASE